MRNLWLSPHNHNPMLIKKAINQRLNDMFYQQWHSNISEMSSCTFYRMFKCDFKLEKYLLKLNKSEQINLCKFRCRNTKLPVVVLGYATHNIDYGERLCKICNLNEVGDEYHYIMKCTYFFNSRGNILKVIFGLIQTMINFLNYFKVLIWEFYETWANLQRK